MIDMTMAGQRVTTLWGQYTVIRDCGRYGTGDGRHGVWIGRHSDGHCDMLVCDNGSVWVLGDADDADVNRDQWAAATSGVDANVLIEHGREEDASLGNWLKDRWAEATEQQ